MALAAAEKLSPSTYFLAAFDMRAALFNTMVLDHAVYTDASSRIVASEGTGYLQRMEEAMLRILHVVLP